VVIVGKKITILFQFSNGKQLAVAGAGWAALQRPAAPAQPARPAAAGAGWAALQAAAKSCGLRSFTYSNPLRPQI